MIVVALLLAKSSPCANVLEILFIRFTGTIIAIGGNAPPQWTDSEWRSLKVCHNISIYLIYKYLYNVYLYHMLVVSLSF